MQRPPRKCGRPGCFTLVESGQFCHRHGGMPREGARRRGYDGAWEARRADYLRHHPRCAVCDQPATVADHIIPRRSLVARGVIDPDADHLLQPMCRSCHSSKTARQDGGFGR